jgi:hypothetical protein
MVEVFQKCELSNKDHGAVLIVANWDLLCRPAGEEPESIAVLRCDLVSKGILKNAKLSRGGFVPGQTRDGIAHGGCVSADSQT